MPRAFQYQSLARDLTDFTNPADPLNVQGMWARDVDGALFAHRRQREAAVRRIASIVYDHFSYLEWVTTGAGTVASEHQWAVTFPDFASGPVQRAHLTGGLSAPVPFGAIMSLNFAPDPAVYPSQFWPPLFRPRYEQHVFAPVPFLDTFQPTPLFDKAIFPEQAPGRPATPHLVPFFATETEPSTFGYQVWQEPGTTPIVSTWTEPAVTLVVTTWTEPAITPIVTTWTETT